jgi:hypothetical protein
MNKTAISTILGLFLLMTLVFAQIPQPEIMYQQNPQGRGRVVGVVVGVRIETCPVSGQQVLIVTIRIDSDHDGDYDENDLEYEIVFYDWTDDLYNALLAAKVAGTVHTIEWTWVWVPGCGVKRKLTRVQPGSPPDILPYQHHLGPTPQQPAIFDFYGYGPQ